jgi:CBS domain-containing protein
MQVRDVMTRGAECARPEDTLQHAAERMKALEIGVLPVCENDRIVGMITDRDITVRATADGAAPGTARVRDVMTPDVVYCFEEQDASEASRLMKENQIRRLVVLNSDKRLVGIVSLGDLAVESGDERLAGHTLEAISEPNRPNR